MRVGVKERGLCLSASFPILPFRSRHEISIYSRYATTQNKGGRLGREFRPMVQLGIGKNERSIVHTKKEWAPFC